MMNESHLSTSSAQRSLWGLHSALHLNLSGKHCSAAAAVCHHLFHSFCPSTQSCYWHRKRTGSSCINVWNNFCVKLSLFLSDCVCICECSLMCAVGVSMRSVSCHLWLKLMTDRQQINNYIRSDVSTTVPECNGALQGRIILFFKYWKYLNINIYIYIF